MVEPDLPAELAEMEKSLREALAGVPGQLGPPGVGLRVRVLAAVRGELRAARRGAFLWFLVGTAAAALLWVNLSMSLVNNTWPVVAAPGAGGVKEMAAQMRTLMPELSAGEARREAAAALARTRLAPAGPLPVPVYSSHSTHARNKPWDTH
jgi:hypothetical protein